MSAPRLLAMAAAAALCVAAAPASAQVRYDFEAFSSFDFFGEQFAGSFSVVTSDFITANAHFEPADLLSCTVTVTPAAPASCRYQEVLFDIAQGYGVVSFGVQTAANPGTGIYYYFDTASFSSIGTHESQIFGSDQFATLTVSAVPEPATAASLLGGLALLAAWRRRAATA